jgi:hypothetical protein
MWKYEQEFRIDKPETVGEKDKHFDLDNYKDWLEEQLTDCRKQLSIQRVVWQSEQLCEGLHSTDFNGKCFKCGEQVFVREPK